MIRFLVFVVLIWIYGVMIAIYESCDGFEIYIGVVGPITSGLVADLMCDPVDEDLNFVDLCVHAVFGFRTSIISKVGCALLR